MKFYHVCENGWNGKELESLETQCGEDKAIDMFIEKWPDAESLAPYHIMVVHLYSNLDQAQDHKNEFGGELLEINIPEDEVEDYITIDTLEFDHPTAKEIPVEFIKKVA